MAVDIQTSLFDAILWVAIGLELGISLVLIGLVLVVFFVILRKLLAQVLKCCTERTHGPDIPKIWKLSMKAIRLMLRFIRLPILPVLQQLQLLGPFPNTLFLIWIEISSFKPQIVKIYGALKQQYLGYIRDLNSITHGLCTIYSSWDFMDFVGSIDSKRPRLRADRGEAMMLHLGSAERACLVVLLPGINLT